MRNFLHHLFIPKHSNNYRAKILHASFISMIAVLLFFLAVSVQYIKTNNPQILGISYSINMQELLFETNKQRESNGLPPLVLNEQLSQAAREKARHMIQNNYWAHFAPDGTTPWIFIKNSGYNYTFAGENLAKGFTNSSEVVSAWMNSASHKENILSSKYNEIGFAILEGSLEGEETVLVVQMFGSRTASPIATLPPSQQVAGVPNIEVKNLNEKLEQTQAVQQNPQSFEKVVQEEAVKKPLIDSKKATKNVGMVLTIFFAAILLLDLIIVERKKIPRIAGHNLDHVIIFILFGLFILLQTNTSIL